MQNCFTVENGILTYKRRREIVRIEGWGENGLRVRATENHGFTAHDWALSEEVSHEAKVWVENRSTKYGHEDPVPERKGPGAAAGALPVHGAWQRLRR